MNEYRGSQSIIYDTAAYIPIRHMHACSNSMCVCTRNAHTCTHACTHAHTDACTHAHTYAHTCAHTRTHTRTHTHTRAYTHTHTRARAHTRTPAHTHACTHTHTRTHARTHAYTHTPLACMHARTRTCMYQQHTPAHTHACNMRKHWEAETHRQTVHPLTSSSCWTLRLSSRGKFSGSVGGGLASFLTPPSSNAAGSP